MAILLSWGAADLAVWRRCFDEELGVVDLRVFPDVGAREDIEHAAVWMHPVGDLKTYPRLKAIYSIGAGASHVLRDPELPDVPIVRMVDDTIRHDMAAHLLYWVLHFHRHYHQYALNQTSKTWARRAYPPNHEITIGILGFGVLGQAAAQHFANLGYRVIGWSRTPKPPPSVLALAQSHSGYEGLSLVLKQSQYLINLLPNTAATRGLVNANVLAQLPAGAFLINAGRGESIVDEDLLAALDGGQLAGAALDVFFEEPLPADHPYWSHPSVWITPHAAAPSDQAASARCIAKNMKRVMQGLAPFPIVDRSRGY